MLVPISYGFEKCPTCKNILHGYSPPFGNVVGSPLLLCKRCNKECISYQKVEWLFLSTYHKVLYLCNVVLFSICIGCVSIGVGLFASEVFHWNISVLPLASFFVAAVVAVLLTAITSIYCSIRRTRNAEYIYRLHRANALHPSRMSLVGVVGLSLIAIPSSP